MIIGSGGSAFTDGGLGAIHALDILEFKLKNGMILGRQEYPLIHTISEIDSVSIKEEHKKGILNDLEILMPCDVNNPLLGLKGSAYVFGPQKGAEFDDLTYLDK